jgi:small multidrug resistance pump
MNWILLSLAIASEVTATSFLKASDGFTRLAPSVGVVIGYAVSFYLVSLTLRTIPVGVVYAIWSAAGIVLIALIGYVIYHQALDVPAVIGIALILAGVIVIFALSSASR